jgi:hypothetical protein
MTPAALWRRSSCRKRLATTLLGGVFIADSPLDVNEGAVGDEVLEVILPSEINIADRELIEEGKPYREWCVPAALRNEHATLRLLNEDEADKAEALH